MESHNLTRLLLLIVFIIAILQIIHYFYPEHKENMISEMTTPDPYLEMPQFFIKDNRYAVEKHNDKITVDPLPTNPGLSCAPKIDWTTNYEPGANNTYGDLLWQKISPRLVLQNNCLNCDQYKANNDFNNPDPALENERSLHKYKENPARNTSEHVLGGITSGLPPMNTYAINL